LSFSRQKGLFAGVSLDGAVMSKRDGWNEAYYHKEDVTPTQILIKGAPTNKDAAALKTQLSKLAAAK
jgi:SH3 domain-containing YSC84-like protein 1